MLTFAASLAVVSCDSEPDERLVLTTENGNVKFDTIQTDSSEIERAYKRRLVYTLFDQIFNTDKDLENFLEDKNAANSATNRTASTGDFEVFGWHPYWLGDTYFNYDYKQLSTVSFFSYTMSLQENGHIQYDRNGWGSSASEDLIWLAHQDSCNVTLSLRCQEYQAVEHLLQNDLEQEFCIQELINLITGDPGAEGINISFDKVPGSYGDEFTSFLTKLSTQLDALDKALILTLPAIPDQSTYQFQHLNKIVDQYVIMGFNYYYSGSTKPGPVAPYKSGDKWGDLNLYNTLLGYLSKGIERQKLIMALPTYGASWEQDTLVSGYVKTTFKEHRRLNQILADLDGAPPFYDTIAQSAYYTYQEAGKNYICYFDDVNTLRFKFNWIRQEKLGGVGIWALGYNDGRQDIWNLLANEYTVRKNFEFKNGIPIEIIEEKKNEVGIDTPAAMGGTFKTILRQKEVVTMILIMLGIFLFAGLLITFFSVYDKIVITEWSTYFKTIGIYFLIILILIVLANFVLLNNEVTAQSVSMDIKTTAIFSDYIVPVLIYLGIIGFMIITVMSWRLFLTLNSDLP